MAKSEIIKDFYTIIQEVSQNEEIYDLFQSINRDIRQHDTIYTNDCSFLFNKTSNETDLRYFKDRLSNNTKNHPYFRLLWYQIEECSKKKAHIQNEGFQTGEDWNGDIKNAEILFLSSNPAYEFEELSPRYDLNNK